MFSPNVQLPEPKQMWLICFLFFRLLFPPSKQSALVVNQMITPPTHPPQPVEASDDAFWDQFWSDSSTSVQDVFALVPSAEIRAVREESPSNLATLCYKVSRPQSATSGSVLDRASGAGPLPQR